MMRRYSPFDEFDRLFDRMGRELGRPAATPPAIAVDVAVADDAFVVTADLPGFERDEIELTVDDSVMTLTAERHHATDEHDDGACLHRERRSASIQRRLTLPDAVDREAAHASYHNGVLTVTLPKLTATAVDDHRIDTD